MMNPHPTIAVLGLTHLGCVLSACWAKLGFKTIAIDENKVVIENLNKGIPPIFEPNLEVEIEAAKKEKNILFSRDLKNLSSADYIFLGYDTHVNEDDIPDTSPIHKKIEEISSILKNGAIVIVSSQLPIGYSSILRNLLKMKNPSLELAYSPENLQLGQALFCYLNPGRIILGVQDQIARDKCLTLFHSITQNIQVVSLESAELIKHGINSFLALSIVFANELSNVCEKYRNASISDVVTGIKSDLRIGPKAYLAPGIGFSGGTLGRDLAVLNSVLKTKEESNLFGFIYQKNRERKKAIITKIKEILPSLKGKTIGVLGLTYKPKTSTLRRSLPLEIVDLLSREEVKIQVFDPKADYASLTTPLVFTPQPSLEMAAKGVDLLLLLTEWPEFQDADWDRVKLLMKSPSIFDTKNFLNQKKLTELGFNYRGVGVN